MTSFGYAAIAVTVVFLNLLHIARRQECQQSEKDAEKDSQENDDG